jgi:hypothetical protein
MPKKLRPAVDLVAFKCRTLKVNGENISFDANLDLYIYSTNIPPIMIINRVYENQNLLSLWLVSFLVGLRICQHPVKLFILLQ